MRSLRVAAVMVLVLGIDAEAVKKAAKCPDASYVVEAPIVPGGPLLSRFDEIVVAGNQVEIASGCEARRARFRRTRAGTKVRVRWPSCGEVSRARLRGIIKKECTEFVGTYVAKGLDPKSIVGLLDPKPPPELIEGTAIGDPVDCGSVPLLDIVEKLCQLLGVSPCISQTNECSTYGREIFTGSRLTNPPPPVAQWNGRGGSGDLMADAIVCTLRQLSPELDGPITSAPVAIDLGLLGSVTVKQEIGFTSFDRLRERFEGYRRVQIDMPIVGSAQAITQHFTVDKTVLGGYPYTAGGYPISAGFGLDVGTEDNKKILTFSPPGFTVATPLGPVSVNPSFTYGTHAAVVTAPYALANLENDIDSLQPGNDWYLRMFDLYGIEPGLLNTATPTTPGTFGMARGGWASLIGLGTRGAVLGQGYWVPPGSGRITRPDLDLLQPRSAAEAGPSAYVSASAEVKWPKNASELLPSWVFQIPFLAPPEAYLTVKPTVQAGVASQLLIGVSEAADHFAVGEFAFTNARLSTMVMEAQANAVGLFTVEAGVHIKVEADFPTLLGGSQTFIDIDKAFPFPKAGYPAAGNLNLAGAASISGNDPSFPATLTALQTFSDAPMGAPGAAAFIEQCYAAEEPTEQPVPTSDPVPGDPSDLANDIEWPCNICVHVTNGNGHANLATIHAQYDALRPSHPEWGGPPSWPASIPDQWIQLLVPASTPPASWHCNHDIKTGCHDLCRWNAESATLTVVREPKDLAPLLPPGPQYEEERNFLQYTCYYEPPA